MKLDKRIRNIAHILTVTDSKWIAPKYIGHTGYFGQSILDFGCLNKCHFDELACIFSNTDCCFGDAKHVNTGCNGYRYFIPVDVLACKEPEKKCRAFTNEEFLALFDSGKLHSIRHGGKQSRYVITCVYFDCEKEAVCVNLNHSDVGLDMRYLFRNGYEYFDGKEWQCFGVEEDSDE